MSIDVNTSSKQPTHFLRAVQLIMEARGVFHVCSENWPYPTEHRFGQPCDRYYAEVWIDGMDWQNSYWIIESDNYNSPKCYPLIIFHDHKNRDSFSEYDWGNLLKAIMYYRRDELWIKHGKLGGATDEVWPFLKFAQPPVTDEQTQSMYKAFFSHASQRPVEFYINTDFVPPRYRFQSSNSTEGNAGTLG